MSPRDPYACIGNVPQDLPGLAQTYVIPKVTEKSEFAPLRIEECF